MASINKLSIRGIRAFSPEDEEQVISFCFPLTIIVGSNGCGKTTIIESLKYAVTGSLPPGNKAGQAFVHDPKSIGSSSVKANIKLRFTNRAGNPMVVVRSMECTQKRTTMSFKALDGIIRTTDPETGQRVSLSHKCTELDRQIPTLMGVSKPILEHVVFCHQEDSSWPLQEGAVLKKRFDDIFDSTRYAKALKAIQELKKEYASNVKDLKADQAGLSAHKKAAEGFREELDEAKEELEKIDEIIATADDKIAREREEARKFQEQMKEIEEIRTRQEEIQQQKEIASATAMSLRDACDEDWTGKHSEDELRSMLSTFDDKMAGDEKRLKDSERAQSDVKNDIERLGVQKNDIHSNLARLVAEKGQHEKDLRQRQDHMEKMGNTYNLELDGVSQTQSTFGGTQGFGTQQSVFSQGTATGRPSLESRASPGGMTGMSQETLVTINHDDMAAFLGAVSKKRVELQTDKDEQRKKAAEEADAMVKEEASLRARMSTITDEREKLKKQTDEALKELGRLKSSSSASLKIRKNDIEDVKKAAAKALKDSDTASKDPRLTVIPQEIRDHEGRTADLKREIEELQRDVKELKQHENELRDVTLLKRQVEDEMEDLEENLRNESAALHKWQVEPTIGPDDGSDENYVMTEMENKERSIESKLVLCGDGLKRLNDDLDSKQKIVSEKAALHSHNMSQMRKLRAQAGALSGPNRGYEKINAVRRELMAYERDVLNFDNTVTVDMEPQNLLDHIASRLSDCKEESDSPEAIVRILKKVRKLYRKSNSEVLTCPCCDRDFATADEARTFGEKMKELPDIIVRSDAERSKVSAEKIKNYTKFREEVSASVRDYLDYKRVSSDMASFEGPAKNNEDELRRLEKELEEKKEEVQEEETNLSELRAVLETMKRLREEASKICKKKGQIRDKEVAIGTNTGSGRDLDAVEKQLAEKIQSKDTHMDEIGTLNKEFSELNARAKDASEKVKELEKKAKEYEERYNREQKSTVRINELNEMVSKYRSEEKKLQDDLAPLRREVNGKETDTMRLRAAHKAEEERLNENLNEFTRDGQKLDELNAKIDKYLDSNKQRELDRLNDDLVEFDEKIDEKKNVLKDMSPEIHALRKKLDDQARHKKNLENNLRVFAESAKEEQLNADLERIHEELDLIAGSNTSENDLRRAQKKIRQYEDDMNQASGRRSGIKDQVRNLKRKLNTEDYKDIDERHRQTMIKLGTTEETVNDLSKYYTALDNALLRYHGLKIADINKIIRELWSLTYKGEDINNIQLVSGNEGGSTKAAKSYNYRVVMTKGTSQLDMRGRCSAGQRVLASIVIRLALAETFCLNCGVMALDEPTTNLDYANKRGLAIALAQIIAARAVQSNFQLVIITHDEDFVSMMKNELSAHTGFNMPERYFQVAREESSDGKFYSKIHAIDWDEI